MNSMIERVTGNGKKKSVREDVPVPCAVVPRAAQRSRMDRLRKRRDPDGIEDNEVEESTVMSRVLGEASGEVIPQDAEELDAGNATITTKLRDVKDVVQEPSYPSGEKEKYLTPYAALTAPDATPDAMKPLDPSDVPGSVEGSEFKTSQLAEPSGEQQAISQPTVNAMDVLLGRSHKPGGAAAKPGDDLSTSTPVMSEAAAARVFQRPSSPEELASQPMPEHKAGTGTEILSAFRRFNG